MLNVRRRRNRRVVVDKNSLKKFRKTKKVHTRPPSIGITSEKDRRPFGTKHPPPFGNSLERCMSCVLPHDQFHQVRSYFNHTLLYNFVLGLQILTTIYAYKRVHTYTNSKLKRYVIRIMNRQLIIAQGSQDQITFMMTGSDNFYDVWIFQ